MRVLIAEDDTTSRLILPEILTQLGHDVVTAANGQSETASDVWPPGWTTTSPSRSTSSQSTQSCAVGYVLPVHLNRVPPCHEIPPC